MKVENLLLELEQEGVYPYIIPYDLVTENFRCTKTQAKKLIQLALKNIDIDNFIEENIFDAAISEGYESHIIVKKDVLIKMLIDTNKFVVIRDNDDMKKHDAIILLAKEDMDLYCVQELDDHFLIYDYEGI